MADEPTGKQEEKKPPPNSVRTGIRNGTVILEFQQAVTGIYMSPVEALIIANALIEKAITIVQNPSRIIRPS